MQINGVKIMAKIVGKIPERTGGKYAATGRKAEEILLKTYTGEDIFSEEYSKELYKWNKENAERVLQDCENWAAYRNILSCIEVSYDNLNGLNVFQNAEKKGLTENMTKEQIDILKKISKDTSFARTLFVASKYTAYVLVAMALTNLYISSHIRFLHNIIQSEETYAFIGGLVFILFCALAQGPLAYATLYKIKRMLNLKQR